MASRLAVLVCLVLAGGTVSARRPVPRAFPPLLPPPADGAKYEGDFEARLRAAPADRHVLAILDLTDQVDLPRLTAQLRLEGRDKPGRRQAVIGALERVAQRQQSLLRPVLDRLLAEGALVHVDAVAIVNRLLVEGTASGLLALGDDPRVARVLPEWSSAPGLAGLAGLAVPETVQGPGERFRSWAVEATGASSLWARGLDGHGVVVAALDTGADGEHEQLRGRRLPGSRGWFDPTGEAAAPYDGHGHGTSVLSQAVGGGVPDRVVGIAPGARWAAGLANRDNQYSRMRMTRAADWVLRSARPDILVNAWSHAEGACPTFDQPFIEAWKAAEIFVVFPAGNAGPGAGTGEAPAQLPGAFAVAGLTSAGIPLPESSRGPSACGDHPFPTLAAPASQLPFAFPSSEQGYGYGHGTSLAAGLVAGGAALLLQALPDLGAEDLALVLRESARDLPPEGPDGTTGAGALDLVAALEHARRIAGPERGSVREGHRAVGIEP